MSTAAPPALPPPPRGKRGWPWTAGELQPLDPTLPAIGIVTPSFNQGNFLEATLRSVLLQGYPNLEFYVEDGGSTDESIEILRRYEGFLSGWVSEKDRGQSHAINKGFARLQRAKWVNWLNSDDILLPGALEAIGRKALAGPSAVAILGRGRHLYVPGGKIVDSANPEGLTGASLRNWRRHSFLQPACFFSLSAFREVGGVNESLHMAMDFELWVKLGEKGEFARIPEFIAQDAQHPDAKTQLAMGRYFAEACEVLYQRGHQAEARQMIEDIYAEFAYMGDMLKMVSENALYKRVLRPLVRRLFAPQHVKDRGW